MTVLGFFRHLKNEQIEQFAFDIDLNSTRGSNRSSNQPVKHFESFTSCEWSECRVYISKIHRKAMKKQKQKKQAKNENLDKKKQIERNWYENF